MHSHPLDTTTAAANTPMTTLAIPMTTPTPHTRSPRPPHLQLYPTPPSSVSSSHSNLSFLSTDSSLSSSSTFSDVSVSSLASIPSPPPSSSKTHAFFASPFPTRPPTPPTPPQRPAKTKTTDFFAIPSIDISTPTTHAIQIQVVDTSDQPTPRPPSLEPTWPVPDEPYAGSIISDPEPSPLSPAFTSPPPAAPPVPPSSSTSLRLLRPLGHGAFSSVWLADDLSPVPLVLKSRRSLRDLRAKSPGAPPSRTSSLRKLRARLTGTSPVRPELLENGLSASLSRASSTKRRPTIAIEDPPASPATRLSRSGSTKGRLVAVKMTRRGGPGFDEEGERTRVAFIREVEVLRHISHPNITPLLTHLTTPTHHLLVLPFLPGGDLLALVNADAAWARLRESVLQRIWAELCRAVSWMHGVGLVHRDIKLENILLTTTAYNTLTPSSPAPTLADLPLAPAPLIKLTDFGLSRFVDIRTDEERRADREARRAQNRSRRASSSSAISTSGSSVFTGSVSGSDREDAFENESQDEDDEDEGPLLSTRCGSEAYAAPELVMGGGGGGRRGVYDARETDAWACGVVLYALVGRRLPFGEGVAGAAAGGHGIGREGGSAAGRAERRHWLMRIARGEYEWPEHAGEGAGDVDLQGDDELMGRGLVDSAGAKRLVGRLLVRDPRKRARVADLFGDAWMGGEGRVEHNDERAMEEPTLEVAPEEAEPEGVEMELDVEEELELALEEEEAALEDGWLVEKDTIDDIARREVV
ncbi:kinase-like domain-containing protein [Collybia nuda]|uniref:non-specific serine/threonine protein kinase n=1 Tax=Collybia nuda TaxID=64659 RepID=A0A9P6CFX5_9AGAR|nr:kinase-like domain-containing protein [Collybia nuda]